MGRFESAKDRRERIASEEADDQRVASRRLEVEQAQQAVHEQSKALAEAEALLSTATAKANEERETRLRDWATLTLASFPHDTEQADAAVVEARAGFNAAAPTPDAFAAFLRLVKALAELSCVHRKALQAASRLGHEPHFVGERSLQIPKFTDAINEALMAHAGNIMADAEDRLHAEITAVMSGE